jgi:cob(I)alamin adenosyltransferase
MVDEAQNIGLIQVYTGDGKGKTTAALGLALRACGHGLSVYMIQFMKGDIEYGELKAAQCIPNLTIIQFGRPDFVDKENPRKEDIDLARKALEHAKDIISSGDHDIVILDELNVALDFKLVDLKDALMLIESKPKNIELIITGRNAPKEILNMADLVTNMENIKHPYDGGISARCGIEH